MFNLFSKYVKLVKIGQFVVVAFQSSFLYYIVIKSTYYYFILN